jgi:hypothetical protein
MKFTIAEVDNSVRPALSRFLPVFNGNPKTFLGNNVLEDYGVLRRRF